MYDTGKILTGLVIFFLLLAAPALYSLSSGDAVNMPDVELGPAQAAAEQMFPGKKPTCILDGAQMKTEHMQMLIDWRDMVVRDAERHVTGIDGKEYVISLSNTCLGCHSNKAEFCDRCHNYASVSPVCWDCHTDPNQIKALGGVQ